MKILLSNDDGYQAPGINVLQEVFSEFADVYVVAPDRNRSGASNSLTLDRPLSIKEYKKNAYYVNGTPTDCVHLALSGLFKDDLPDMVVSGINDGANTGDDVLYSGTVAAAIQGRFLGLPSIAISLNGPSKNFETAGAVAKQLVEKLIKNPLPASTILNVNVPDLPPADLRGYEVTRLGARYNSEKVYKEIDPRGREVYWIGLPGAEQDAGPGTDFYAIRASKVSVTPLSLDFTNYVAFEALSTWVDELPRV
jgi:5'-nucleotidase